MITWMPVVNKQYLVGKALLVYGKIGLDCPTPAFIKWNQKSWLEMNGNSQKLTGSPSKIQKHICMLDSTLDKMCSTQQAALEVLSVYCSMLWKLWYMYMYMFYTLQISWLWCTVGTNFIHLCLHINKLIKHILILCRYMSGQPCITVTKPYVQWCAQWKEPTPTGLNGMKLLSLSSQSLSCLAVPSFAS